MKKMKKILICFSFFPIFGSENRKKGKKLDILFQFFIYVLHWYDCDFGRLSVRRWATRFVTMNLVFFRVSWEEEGHPRILSSFRWERKIIEIGKRKALLPLPFKKTKRRGVAFLLSPPCPFQGKGREGQWLP